MYVEKSKIVDGIIKYVEGVMLPEVASDKGFQILISIGVSAVKANGKILDKLLESEMFKAVAKYDPESKMYDIDLICAALKQSIEKVGYFPVTIPALPFISPEEKELKFSAGDVEKLKNYII